MTLVHDYSTQFTRQDLHANMAPRRRLPHPTSATTTSTTLRSGGEQHPQPILTYSQFLGAFDDTPPTMLSVFHPPGLSYPASSVQRFDSPEPGPSRARGSPRATSEAPLVEIVIGNGWARDVLGGEQWGGHAKIEEVGDDEVLEDELAGGDRDSFERPRARPANGDAPPAGGRGLDMSGFRAHEEENIPLRSTPPPGPRPTKLPSLRETLSHRSLNAFSTLTATVGMDIFSPGAGPSSQALDSDPHEVALVKENLDLVASSQEDVKFMYTFFFAQSAEHDLSRHIDICPKLEEHLESLRRTLTLRTQIGAEEWNVRSPSWHQNYSKRLISLRTTLQRLARMRQLIESQPFRPRTRLAILTKLEQHEAKLADLASKYSTAFDRLRLRHLHFLLTQSHNEAKRLKAQKARLMSRASFERRWREGKAFRAGLRNEFHDLRQEFYNTQRPGRHANSP